MSFQVTVAAVAVCVALTGAASDTASGQGESSPFRFGGKVKHCHNLRFSERLRAHGAGCSEARLVVLRAVRHIEYDPKNGQRIEARVRGRHRTWNCTGTGFNPLPIACRHAERWIKFQVWAD